MRRRSVILSLFTFLVLSASAQNLDLIVTGSGDSIACKIESITDDLIYFETERNGDKLHTQISKADVSVYESGTVDEQTIYRIPNSIFYSTVNPDNEVPDWYIIDGEIYDFRDYTRGSGSPYNPNLSAVSSLLIPGLGHLFAGDKGSLRALAFYAGDIACWAFGFTGFVMSFNLWGPRTTSNILGSQMVLAAGIGTIVIRAWAATNASRIAKVNSMAWQASKKTGYHLELKPNLHQLPNLKLAPGMTLGLNF